MISLTLSTGQKILILEPSNLESLKRNQSLCSNDGQVLVAYTPDIEWFFEQFEQLKDVTEGEVLKKRLHELLAEGMKRPEVHQRTYKEPRIWERKNFPDGHAE